MHISLCNCFIIQHYVLEIYLHICRSSLFHLVHSFYKKDTESFFIKHTTFYLSIHLPTDHSKYTTFCRLSASLSFSVEAVSIPLFLPPLGCVKCLISQTLPHTAEKRLPLSWAIDSFRSGTQELFTVFVTQPLGQH